MSEAKKERQMTARGFLHKANGKVAPAAFLAQYRAWLETGEVSRFTTKDGKSVVATLRSLDQEEILPTPALDEIKQVVLSHMTASIIEKEEQRLANPPSASKPKNWMATIFNAKGEIQTRLNSEGEEEELQKGFDLSSEADRWCDRRLVEGASDWYGVVTHTTMLNRDGDPLSTVIMRDDAMARIFKTAKGPVMKSRPQGTNALSFRPKAKEDKARFSHG